MPTHMRALFTLDEMRTARMAEPFSFTKGCPVMKIRITPNPRFVNAQKEGEDLLFDLAKDPAQQTPIEAPDVKARLLNAMKSLFDENDAPEEMYARYALEVPAADA